MTEFVDLLIFLSIVCVPLAVGAVFIPFGRALARRVEQAPVREAELASRLDPRIEVLEREVAALAIELERVAERQRLLEAPPSSHVGP